MPLGLSSGTGIRVRFCGVTLEEQEEGLAMRIRTSRRIGIAHSQGFAIGPAIL